MAPFPCRECGIAPQAPECAVVHPKEPSAVERPGNREEKRRGLTQTALFRELTADNFTLLAEAIAKRVATYQNGSPTTIIGPPKSGARILNEFWRDALGGDWVCTGAGTPGTWKQVKRHTGGYVWEVPEVEPQCR